MIGTRYRKQCLYSILIVFKCECLIRQCCVDRFNQKRDIIMQKEFFHVSSKLEVERLILIRYQKPLQEYVNFCSRIHCLSFEEYRNCIKQINETFPDIIGYTGRGVYKWATETLFESVRKEQDDSLPSRMNGVFLCSSIIDAIIFNTNFRGNKAKIYRCRIPEEKVFSFNMQLFTNVEENLRNINGNHLAESIFDEQYKMVHKYWEDYKYKGEYRECLCELDLLQLELVVADNRY